MSMRTLGRSNLYILAQAAWLFLLACGASPVSAAAQAPPWHTPMPAGLTIGPPMRFVRVVSVVADCQPNCPEWISAEGDITVGTAQTFSHFIAELGGRRLPILISSSGGSTADGVAMGRLIRTLGLVVGVAHTELLPCPTTTPNCSPTLGAATASGARCLSACTLVLSGGVERFVNVGSHVGVHQIRLGPKTMVTRHYLIQYRIVAGKKEEISRSLTSQDRYTVAPDAKDLAGADSTVALYLKEMGVGDLVMNLMLTTPPSAIHLMNADELTKSRLATIWMYDPPYPDSAGLRGLAGSPVTTSSPLAGTFVVAAQWPILGAIAGRRAVVASQFRYRPGGGAIYVWFNLVDAASGAGFPRPGLGAYLLANAKDAPLSFDERRPGFAAKGWIPRDVFCRLRGSRRAFVEFAEPSFEQSDERRRERLARVDLMTASGGAALFAEACSGPSVATRR
jgi:hypothetical protein